LRPSITINKAFVTGCAGFIGSNLVDRLLGIGCEVVGWDNFSTGQREFLDQALRHQRFRLIEGDSLDASTLTSAIDGAEFVFHLAANADVRLGLHHPKKDLEHNTVATFNVLEAMRYASKHAVVGLVKQLAFELAPQVRVNGVAPGGISTDLRGPESLGMAQRSIASIDLNKIAPERVPIGMVPNASDYAAAYVFFASRQDHIPATGSILNYDGGFGIRGLRQTMGGRELPQRIAQTKPGASS